MRSWTGVDRQLSAILLVGAAVIMFTGAGIAVLSPSLNPAVFTSDLRVYLESVESNPIAWMWAQGLIITGGIVTLFGLVALAQKFQGYARQWGWVGVAAYGLSTVFLALNRILDMSVGILATELLADPNSLKSFTPLLAIDDILGDWWGALAWVSLVATGIALIRTAGIRVKGTAFTAVGLVGLGLDLIGATIPAMIFFATAALGIATRNIQRSDPNSTHAAR